MTKDYSRSLELLCPTCAGAMFEFDESIDESIRRYQCNGCNSSFDHVYLMQANSSRINAELDAIGDEVFKDAVNKFRKSFAGNRFMKIK